MATILTDTLKKYAAIAGIGILTYIGLTHGGKSVKESQSEKKEAKTNIEWMLSQQPEVPSKNSVLWDLSKNPRLASRELHSARTVYLDNLKRRLEVYLQANTHAKGKKAVEKAFNADRIRYMQDRYDNQDPVALRNFQINEIANDKLNEIFKEIEKSNPKGPEIAFRDAMLSFQKIVNQRWSEDQEEIRSNASLDQQTDTPEPEKSAVKEQPSAKKAAAPQTYSNQATEKPVLKTEKSAETQTVSVETQAAKAQKVADRIAAAEARKAERTSALSSSTTQSNNTSTQQPQVKDRIVGRGQMDIVVPRASTLEEARQGQKATLTATRVDVVQDERGRIFMEEQPPVAKPVIER